jgi:hypothetical protein
MLLDNRFRDTIGKFIRWALNSDDLPNLVGSGDARKVGVAIRSDTDLPVTFNFTITNASGGKVVVVRHYDSRTDRSHENVYIITDNDNLGDELEQIITKESLTK